MHRRRRRPARVPVPPGGTCSCSIRNTAVAAAADPGQDRRQRDAPGRPHRRPRGPLAPHGPTSVQRRLPARRAVTAVPVPIGTYNLSETGPPGYTASPWSCVGGTGTATSVALAARSGRHLHDHQHDGPAAADSAQAGRQHLRRQRCRCRLAPARYRPLDHPGSSLASPPSRTQSSPSGTYTLAETAGPTGYTTASPWTCTGAASSDAAAGTVTVAAGNSATCTITNTDQPAKLTLAKVVDTAASGSGKVPADWTLTRHAGRHPGQAPVTGNGDPATAGGVNQRTVFSGSYDLSETGPAGSPRHVELPGGVVSGVRRWSSRRAGSSTARSPTRQCRPR